MVDETSILANANRIKTFRWLFYISSLQLLAYFIVPMKIFPGKYIYYIEIISALTLGLIVGLFYLLVNIAGFFIDKRRRRLYLILIIFVILWFLWAAISWSYIEHMDYILK